MQVKKYFKYKEVKRDSKNIEFGWAPCEPITSGKLVLATSSHIEEWDNAAALADYESFFLKFTKTTASKFLEKWKDSPKEYNLYWYNHMPASEPGSHIFFLKLAELICKGTTFEHTFAKGVAQYQVVDVPDESKRKST